MKNGVTIHGHQFPQTTPRFPQKDRANQNDHEKNGLQDLRPPVSQRDGRPRLSFRNPFLITAEEMAEAKREGKKNRRDVGDQF